MPALINRTGEVNYNKHGTKMVIIDFKRSTDIIVEFQDEHKFKRKTTYSSFKIGSVNNPYDKSVHKTGFIGEGPYKSRIGKESKILEPYATWSRILSRCYDPVAKKKLPAYEGCTMFKPWHNLQIFGSWYEENFYQIPNEKMEIDKDILVKWNKIYGPETCVFVSRDMNRLLERRVRARGQNPIGVSWNKGDKYFESCCSYKNKRVHHTFHKNEIEAFLSYKNFKENLLKNIAEEYKYIIPVKLYNALVNYEVEISD